MSKTHEEYMRYVMETGSVYLPELDPANFQGHTMKAFRVSENELWAANSAEEAKAHYQQTTGEQVDEDEFVELTDAELDEDIPEYDDDEVRTGNTTTLRRYLNEMSEPGFLAGHGW